MQRDVAGGGEGGWKNALLRFLPAVGTAGDRAGDTLGGGMLSPGVLRRSLAFLWGCSPIPITPSLSAIPRAKTLSGFGAEMV